MNFWNIIMPLPLRGWWGVAGGGGGGGGGGGVHFAPRLCLDVIYTVKKKKTAVRLVSRSTSVRFRGFGSRFSSKRLWFVDNEWNIKRLSSLPILMQESFWWWQWSDRYIYIIFLFPPPPYPLPHFSMVSVDVKHHVYLLYTVKTSNLCSARCTKNHHPIVRIM